MHWPTRRHPNVALGSFVGTAWRFPPLPLWLKRAPVFVELIVVLELTLLAAITVRVAWIQLEDRPSAVALWVMTAIVIARCWYGWWRAATDDGDQH